MALRKFFDEPRYNYDPKELKSSVDLEPLRNRVDFKALVAEREAKTRSGQSYAFAIQGQIDDLSPEIEWVPRYISERTVVGADPPIPAGRDVTETELPDDVFTQP